MVPHNTQILNIPPRISPPIPPSLPHQTHDSLLLCPALFDGYIGQVRSAVAFAVVGERNTDPMGAEIPIQGMRGRFEVHEKRDGIGEGVQFGGGNGGKPGIVEGTRRRDV